MLNYWAHGAACPRKHDFMTEAKLEYHRKWREANKAKTAESFKRWHETNGKTRYYENLDLTRAIKRKAYYKQVGNTEAMENEQATIDQLRLLQPAKKTGVRQVLSADENHERRKASMRKHRYRHLESVAGMPLSDLVSPKACDVCGGTKKICLDHCHETAKLRGWLCDDCNIALGRVKDDVGRLRNLIAYLEKHKGEI